MIAAVLAAADTCAAGNGSRDHKTVGDLYIAAVFSHSAADTGTVGALGYHRTAADIDGTALFRFLTCADARACFGAVCDRVDLAAVDVDRTVFAGSAAADRRAAVMTAGCDASAVDRDSSGRSVCFPRRCR